MMSDCGHEWQTEGNGAIICRRCWAPQIDGIAIPIVYQAYAEKIDFTGDWRDDLREAFDDLKRHFYEVVAMRPTSDDMFGTYDPNRQIGIRTKII